MTVLSRAARPFRAHPPRTSRRLLLAVVVLVLGGLLPGTASAQSERGFLVVEGRGGTTVEWQVGGSSPLLVDPTSGELTGGGPYAGVLVESLEQPRTGLLGAVQVRAFDARTRGVVSPLGADGQLEPGRYRVTLLGQGAVRARYRLADRDAPGVQVRTGTRIPVTFLGRAEPLPFGQSGAQVELPRAAAARKRVVQVALLDGTAVDDMRMCATVAGACDDVLPVCLPSPSPCSEAGARSPRVRTGQPVGYSRLHLPVDEPRSLIWSVNGYRETDDRLRAAAIVF